MVRVPSGRARYAAKQGPAFSTDLSKESQKQSNLAAWTTDRNLGFLVTSIRMIVMLLWAGSYKLTTPGAEGIVPLVSNSPLISWHFKLFGPYVGSDIFGVTEITAAILMIGGYLRPKAGIAGGLIGTLMFSVTSTMLITTPGTTISVHGIRYMNLLGLFLFKEIICLGASLYLVGYFGEAAILHESEFKRKQLGQARRWKRQPFQSK